MSMIPSTCPQVLPLQHELHVQPAKPKKVASSVVTASQFDEERTLVGTPSWYVTHEERVSGTLGVLWSKEASKSAQIPVPATAAPSASSDEAETPSSTTGSLTGALTPLADQHNWGGGGVSMGNTKCIQNPSF